MCYNIGEIAKRGVKMANYVVIQNGLFAKHELTECPKVDLFYSHTHTSYELLYFLRGNATHVIEGRRYKLRPGDIMIIRPFCYHYVSIDTPECYERYDILFDTDTLGINPEEIFMNNADILHAPEDSVFAETLRHLDYYAERLPEKALRELLPSIVKELCFAISTLKVTENDDSVISPMLTDALKYINSHLSTLSDMREVAEKLFVSESYLYRLFAKELKKTPRAYITEKRLLTAHNLIIKGEKPTEIFAKCGFRDYTAFYRNYKALFGIPPSAKERASSSVETV